MSGAIEKQSGGEFASTDAAAGAQDAALQELWLSAEIPVEPCSRLQHLQRPTPSHLGSDTPDATRRGDENMARGRRSDVRIPVANGSITLASPQRDNTVAHCAVLHSTRCGDWVPERSVARVSKSQIVSIVDDDASVRAAMRSLLKSLGFVAFVFESAEDFLRSSRVDDS